MKSKQNCLEYALNLRESMDIAMIFAAIAFLSGVTVVISRTINARLSDRIGALQGSFFNHVFGLLTSLALVALVGEYGLLRMETLVAVPWWAYLGGMLGVIVVALSSYVSSRSSSLTMTVVIFAGQLFTGALIDILLFGLFTIGKVIGGFILILGLYICLTGDSA